MKSWSLLPLVKNTLCNMLRLFVSGFNRRIFIEYVSNNIFNTKMSTDKNTSQSGMKLNPPNEF